MVDVSRRRRLLASRSHSVPYNLHHSWVNVGIDSRHQNKSPHVNVPDPDSNGPVPTAGGRDLFQAMNDMHVSEIIVLGNKSC